MHAPFPKVYLALFLAAQDSRAAPSIKWKWLSFWTSLQLLRKAARRKLIKFSHTKKELKDEVSSVTFQHNWPFVNYAVNNILHVNAWRVPGKEPENVPFSIESNKGQVYIMLLTKVAEKQVCVSFFLGCWLQ